MTGGNRPNLNPVISEIIDAVVCIVYSSPTSYM